MRKSRRLVVALVVSALVAAGAIVTGLAASANVLTTCDSSATVPHACQIGTQEIHTPTAITLAVTLKSGDGKDDQYVLVSWQGDCTKGGIEKMMGSPTNFSAHLPITTAAPVSVSVTLPYADPDECGISATATLSALLSSTGPVYTTDTTGSFQLALDYTPAASPTASPSSSSSSPVPLVKGYDDKCLDAKGNSSANRTEVIIWTCNSADSAQGWKYTGGELVHNGKCANDRGDGGSGTKVIVWTCNGSPAERWSHTGGDGEFVLASTAHGPLCLTDPDHSKTNRTQLIVYSCRNTSNQHWST
jgi:hypothetical protein